MRPLSAAGRQAAERVADLLAPLNIAAIHSSPYTRAIQTVQPLATRLRLPIQPDDELRERHLGDDPMADFKAAVRATWDDFAFAHPGGESSAAAQARISRAIARIAATPADGNIAIASHGNAIALFLHTLDPAVDFTYWDTMSLPDVHAIDARPGAPWTFRRAWQPTLE